MRDKAHDVQKDFECREPDCKNRVSVYDDNKLCLACRQATAEMPEDKEVWEFPHTA